ncbi:fumarylacetoacetate hydrolase family protein [Nonomuraea sp. NBC_01738]|uniref:2-keto-4-pentenoate hydratase n=1 Tax=Nonomuraea sp. NBC_01738 TaxID=2976003 RepID=UPI002E10A522|nr:fumarylacetoacetate hydrolase family protein [Nonomuraea sp. NBC_01738]
MHDEWSEAVDTHSQAADRLLEAARSGKQCPPVRDLLATAADGYAVQEINTRRALAEGRRPVGRKIGLTNAEAQRRFGIDQPDCGMLFADMALPEGQPVALSRFLQPKVEAEVAFVMAADLEGGPFTVADVIRAVDFVLPAIEIADSRVADWDITLTDTIADNGSAGMFVLGNTPMPLRGLDLGAAAMTMTSDGVMVSAGSGAAVLGHPLNALVWLAGFTGDGERPLRAGDVVLTGTMGPVVDPAAGQSYEARIEGLGTVRVSFG